MNQSKIWAIVPAGGVGARMGAELPKQYLPLADKTIIEQTLSRLCMIDRIDAVLVGIAKQDAHWRALQFKHAKLLSSVEAGKQRVDTVEQCLKHIIEQGGEDDWALVHDAARPCVRADEILNLIDAVLKANQGGLLALPISDTIKRSTQIAGVECADQTIPRDHLWRAMTPQMFKVGELVEAINIARECGIDISDEASAMETAGIKPLLVLCSADNIKITLPQDLALAEAILQAQEESTK